MGWAHMVIGPVTVPGDKFVFFVRSGTAVVLADGNMLVQPWNSTVLE